MSSSSVAPRSLFNWLAFRSLTVNRLPATVSGWHTGKAGGVTATADAAPGPQDHVVLEGQPHSCGLCFMSRDLGADVTSESPTSQPSDLPMAQAKSKPQLSYLRLQEGILFSSKTAWQRHRRFLSVLIAREHREEMKTAKQRLSPSAAREPRPSQKSSQQTCPLPSVR